MSEITNKSNRTNKYARLFGMQIDVRKKVCHKGKKKIFRDSGHELCNVQEQARMLIYSTRAVPRAVHLGH
jgi:hypothetical protein